MLNGGMGCIPWSRMSGEPGGRAQLRGGCEGAGEGRGGSRCRCPQPWPPPPCCPGPCSAHLPPPHLRRPLHPQAVHRITRAQQQTGSRCGRPCSPEREHAARLIIWQCVPADITDTYSMKLFFFTMWGLRNTQHHIMNNFGVGNLFLLCSLQQNAP